MQKYIFTIVMMIFFNQSYSYDKKSDYISFITLCEDGIDIIISKTNNNQIQTNDLEFLVHKLFFIDDTTYNKIIGIILEKKYIEKKQNNISDTVLCIDITNKIELDYSPISITLDERYTLFKLIITKLKRNKKNQEFLEFLKYINNTNPRCLYLGD